jgi:CBS domain-containing protein
MAVAACGFQVPQEWKNMADTVAEIMDPDFFSASQTESIGQILHDMAELGLGSAPVLDLQGHPLGMATLRDIDGCRRLDELPEHIRQPAVSVHQNTGVEAAARTLAEHGADCLILVDDHGVAVGALRALDLLRALLGLRSRPTDANAASRPGDGWSRGALLDLDAAHHAPTAPGIILLGPGEPGQRVNVVWAEAATNIRERLDEMLRMPQSDPRLEDVLGPYPRRLTFHALVVTDAERRSRMFRALRAVLARRQTESLGKSSAPEEKP